MFTVETDPAYWDHCVEWSGGGEPATQEGGQTFYTGWDTPGTKTVTASWCGGTSSQSKQVKVIEVGSVSEDKTKACVNEDITFTANPSPSGPLDCMEWQYHYRPDSTSEWEEWTRVIDEDETTVLNTSTAGYYQYQAKNHVHDEGWKLSSEVEIVNCDPAECESCINGDCKVCGGDTSKCCDDGTCVDKCTMTGQCSYTPPETSNYVTCKNFNPTDKSCEDIIEGALCNHLVTVGLNEAECADCAPNCDKTRICACAEITPFHCKTICFWDGIPPCACVCDAGEPYTSGDYYQCD